MKQSKCEKNIVKISTPESESTGVLLKCNYINAEYKKKYYMIITNAHAINYDLLTEDYRNISLVFYNDSGERIKRLFDKSDSENGYRIIDVFKNEQIYELDIMAILIEVCGNNCISLVEEYYINDVKNGTNILVLGYPGILNEDNVNRMVRLNCAESILFPQNEDIRAYKIVDDIHYYSNLDDKMILQGLSGAPVFGCIDNSYFFMGVNKSISIVENGKNPFKQVYYLKIKSILKFLYKNEIIVYKQNDKYSFTIKWIKYKNNGENNDKNNNKKGAKLILVGGSGSGKSSIVKSLAFNKKHIDSVGDGQTTRNNVFYHYCIKQDQFKMKVCFYKNLDEFKYNIISKIEKEKLFEVYKILSSQHNNKNPANYKDFLLQYYNYIQKKNYFKSSGKTFIGKSKKPIEIKSPEPEISKIENILIDDNQNDVSTAVFDIFCEAFENYSIIIPEMNTDENESICRKIYTQLCKIEGFFSVKEIEKVIGKKISLDDEEVYNNVKTDYLKKLNDKEGASKLTFSRIIENFFEYIYKGLIKNIENYVENISEGNGYKIEYKREEKELLISVIDSGDSVSRIEELIKFCLKVDDGKSLTSMIKEVEVYDKISENFAYILDELDIDKLLVVDTCGLDHLSSMDDTYVKDYFGNLYSQLTEKVGNVDNLGAVFVKKLDSEKPDELRRFLPLLELKLGMAQPYLLLTGSDIEFRKGFEIEDIFVQDELRKIRIIRYMKEYIDTIFNNECKRKVFEKNINIFCGIDDIIETNFSFSISNYKSIYKLLASIRMEEKNSIEILEFQAFDFIEKNLEKFVDLLFEYSSANGRHKGPGSPQIQRANTDRLAKLDTNKDRTLGYWGVSNDMYYKLFSDGYDEATCKFNEEIAGNNNEIIIQALKNCKEDILGDIAKLRDIEDKSGDERGKKFRECLKMMYEDNFISKHEKSDKYSKEDMLNKFIYLYSPFQDDYCGMIKKDKETMTTIINGINFSPNEVFDNMYDFIKGYKKEEIKEEFVKLFVDKVRKRIEEDKKQRVVNILRLDSNFKSSLENFEQEFNKQYGKNDDKTFFVRFMKKYFEYREKISDD